MPNGFPYFLFSSEDYCKSCDRPLCEHDRVKVFPEDGPSGSWHWRYRCSSGRPAVIPEPGGWGE